MFVNLAVDDVVALDARRQNEVDHVQVAEKKNQNPHGDAPSGRRDGVGQGHLWGDGAKRPHEMTKSDRKSGALRSRETPGGAFFFEK